jgi:Protein of unknown function (DUF1353)
MKLTVLALVALLPTSCSDLLYGWHYDATDTGDLKGRLVVEWVDQDKFVFIPDPQNPLTFKRKSDNDVIVPQRMYTDGGSIPAALRAFRSYSPWGYAPAFIIHDWLFVMKECKVPGYEKYDLDKAATIMSEVMKTVMENPKYGGPNKLVHYSMYEAVRSKVAQDYWDHGRCETPEGARTAAGPAAARSFRSMAAPTPSETPRPRFVIEF